MPILKKLLKRKKKNTDNLKRKDRKFKTTTTNNKGVTVNRTFKGSKDGQIKKIVETTGSDNKSLLNKISEGTRKVKKFNKKGKLKKTINYSKGKRTVTRPTNK